MDQLPLELLVKVVQKLPLRQRFVVMCVSRSWQLVVRSLLSEQQRLLLLLNEAATEAAACGAPLDPDALLLPKEILSSGQVWQSLVCFVNLRDLEVRDPYSFSEWEAEKRQPIGHLVRNNAASLRSLSLPVGAFDWKTEGADVSLPLLTKLIGCSKRDLELIVKSCPKLRHLHLKQTMHMRDSDLELVSQLKCLECLEIPFSWTCITAAGVLALIRACPSLTEVRISVGTPLDREEIDAELAKRERMTGRTTVLEVSLHPPICWLPPFTAHGFTGQEQGTLYSDV